MPRRARLTLPGVPHHVVQRGHNREATFFDDVDYQTYLDDLRQGAERYGCAVHAYVLMTNHVHLLLTPAEPGSLSRLMRYLGSRYVHYVNYVYQRSGTLWEGRFKSCMVDADNYLLSCYRYIEMNPVRAGMVQQPNAYRWSSYAHHALGATNELIQDHPAYQALGQTDAQQCENYQALFQNPLDELTLTEIRSALNQGLVLGTEQFKDEVEAATARRVRAGRPGRRKAEAGGQNGERSCL